MNRTDAPAKGLKKRTKEKLGLQTQFDASVVVPLGDPAIVARFRVQTGDTGAVMEHADRVVRSKIMRMSLRAQSHAFRFGPVDPSDLVHVSLGFLQCTVAVVVITTSHLRARFHRRRGAT